MQQQQIMRTGTARTSPWASRYAPRIPPASYELCMRLCISALPEYRQQVAEIGDRVVGDAVPVGLLALVRIEHHRGQAGLPGAEDVPVHVVADVHRVGGGHVHPVQRGLEQPPVRLAVT